MLMVACMALLFAPSPTTAALLLEQATIRIEAGKQIPITGTNGQPSGTLPAHPPITFNVELRPEEALRLEYIHTLNTLTPDSGVMIVLDTPTIMALPAMNVFTPVDALMLDETGRISQVTPSVILADIKQPIRSKKPIKAIVFLQAGQAAASSLVAGDSAVGHMFSNPVSARE